MIYKNFRNSLGLILCLSGLSACGKKPDITTPDGTLAMALDSMIRNDLATFRSTLSGNLQKYCKNEEDLSRLRNKIETIEGIGVGQPKGGPVVFWNDEKHTIQTEYVIPISSGEKRVGEFVVICTSLGSGDHFPAEAGATSLPPKTCVIAQVKVPRALLN